MVVLRAGEQVVLSERAWELGAQHEGLLTLTTERLVFEVPHGGVGVRVGPVHLRTAPGTWAGRVVLDVPRGQITVAGTSRPLVGNAVYLDAGSKWHHGRFQVADVAPWLSALGVASPPPPAPSSVPSVGAPDPPGPPPGAGPTCPLCGSVQLRADDGSFRCPTCSPG